MGSEINIAPKTRIRQIQQARRKGRESFNGKAWELKIRGFPRHARAIFQG
jgi:hypothetical protein